MDRPEPPSEAVGDGRVRGRPMLVRLLLAALAIVLLTLVVVRLMRGP